MDKTEKITYIILVILAFTALGFTIYSAFFAGNGETASKFYATQSNYNKFVAAEDSTDKCKTPEGYDEQSWKEHMSHHHDRYKECL